MTTAPSRLLTLIFTDLVASTALKSEKGDVAASEILARHRTALSAAASETGGRVENWAGDGCFLTFNTPSAAVQFALRVQAVHRADSSLPGVRIGIHVGEVMEHDRDGARWVEGLAVDLAARIQSLALPGQILMSTEVFNSSRQQLRSEVGETSIAWRAHGPYVLKGFDDPIGICEAGVEGEAPLHVPENSEKASRAVQPHEEAAFGWRPAVGLAIPGRQHWVIERQLGTGGFGEVWLAENTQSHERHVFKFCFEPDRIRGLKREVVLFNILKQKLGSHEGIARLLDWELETPPYFIEAEYTEGGDLRDWAARQGGLAAVPMETRVSIVAQVAGALADAHRAGVLHKDIKPANVLIRGSAASPHAVITDFGIGLLMDPQSLKHGMGATGLTKTLLSGSSSTASGSAMYMAPEILEGKPPTERSDIYSLGVVLYQLVVGDFSRALAPGWERDVDDPLLREDIAASADGQPEKRLQDCGPFAERLRTIAQRRQRAESEQRRTKIVRWSAYAAAAILLLAAIGGAASYVKSGQQTRSREAWARNEALPQIKTLISGEEYFDAYQLAREVQRVIPEDPALHEALDACSNEITIRTTPTGATVMYKPYEEPDANWIPAGIAPLEEMRLPRGFLRWRLELDGYESREFVEVVRSDVNFYDENPLYNDPLSFDFSLYRAADTPTGTIPIEKGNILPGLLGVSNPAAVDAFFIDRTEVTNRDYLDFVAAGGYDNPEFWREAFIRDGADISFADSREAFVDSTGRPGPATWELGRFAAGKDDYPVGGVSWYEAMAYACFRSKQLPTMPQWCLAAQTRFDMGEPFSPYIVPLSNFSGEGPAPVGKFRGMGFGGPLDIAGNVREWCYTGDGQGNHYSLGGAWNDAGYMFNIANALSPWDRSATNGFRCIAMPQGTAVPPQLTGSIVLDQVDLKSVVPASDEAFDVLRSGYAYSRSTFGARTEKRETVMPGIVEEVVTVDSPAADDRLILHIYMPTDKKTPLPAVIYHPGIDCLIDSAYDPSYILLNYDFVARSGRAFVVPEFKGAWTRGGGRTIQTFYTVETARDYFVSSVKELGRTIDYLSERPDIDVSRVCLMGLSLGSAAAPYALAIEKRISLGVLVSGGLVISRLTYSDPTLNPINYLSRITQPVILISGRYDYVYPVKESQEQLIARLGTPDDDKTHVVIDGGHNLPRLMIMNEALPWLDKYQPVPE
jgi:serine/threonine protein kinase/class 3 adenylate cyclase/dienelactone hydrolase